MEETVIFTKQLRAKIAQRERERRLCCCVYIYIYIYMLCVCIYGSILLIMVTGSFSVVFTYVLLPAYFQLQLPSSSDESSWLRAKGLLVQVASYAESTGYEVPCLIVAAKGDLEPYPTAIQDSTKESQYLGIEAPIRISTKLGNLNNVFREIMRAAEYPDESIPKLKGKSQNLYLKTFEHVLILVSVVVGTRLADAINWKCPSS
uniref:mitochondrial Rho GTPase 1-like isoform X2 n=1 Tax=Erigeron canadensis TaxID=72917 RepID=UPI001CB8D7A9|nr:mitochondrial Rho GTPase 1-like isoform X2 [Erigeron canadensis]